MKTENTVGNKIRFFGLYISQYVAKETKFPKSPTIRPYNVLGIDATSFYHLELKPIESVSDEELLSFAKYYNEKNFNEMIQSFEIVLLGEKFLINQMKELFAIQKNNQYDWSDFQRMYADWFRANGFACEWLKLSVQDLMDYGWIKLKE